jgi:hypothetical protein
MPVLTLIYVLHRDVLAVLLAILDGQVTACFALGAFAVPPRRAAGGQSKEKRKRDAETYQT